MATKKKKPLSNAERQAKYRKDNAMGKGKNLRINNWVSQEAYFCLERLANYYCTTKKEMLEVLLTNEDEQLRESLPHDDLNKYLKL